MAGHESLVMRVNKIATRKISVPRVSWLIEGGIRDGGKALCAAVEHRTHQRSVAEFNETCYLT